MIPNRDNNCCRQTKQTKSHGRSWEIMERSRGGHGRSWEIHQGYRSSQKDIGVRRGVMGDHGRSWIGRGWRWEIMEIHRDYRSSQGHLVSKRDHGRSRGSIKVEGGHERPMRSMKVKTGHGDLPRQWGFIGDHGDPLTLLGLQPRFGLRARETVDIDRGQGRSWEIIRDPSKSTGVMGDHGDPSPPPSRQVVRLSFYCYQSAGG